MNLECDLNTGTGSCGPLCTALSLPSRTTAAGAAGAGIDFRNSDSSSAAKLAGLLSGWLARRKRRGDRAEEAIRGPLEAEAWEGSDEPETRLNLGNHILRE